ncbi:MAG: hypothetical protein JWO65_414 [Sphingomonas bacterium]|nr:hypothetical protein [Sphingomonas bacterium]
MTSDPAAMEAAPRRWWVTLAALILLAATVQLAAFWPGIMIWDAIRQYGQALSGQYDDWHPPAMNWLWRELGLLGSGPAPMLVLQALLYWGGFALLAGAALRGGRKGLAIALVACALLPIPFVLIGTVLKDSLMAGALLTAAGLAAWRRPGEWPLRIVAIALLIAAAALRFNAVPACLPLLVALLPTDWRRTWPRLILTTIIAAIPLFVALPLANTALRADRSGVELSLVVYDLGGIGRFAGVDLFPPVGVADPVAVNARCYTPVSWDVYAWWGPAPCAIGYGNIRPALEARHDNPYRLWAGAIVAHPIAYAEHRLAHFDSNMRFLVHDADEPVLTLQTDPNPWNYSLPPRALRSAIGALAGWTLRTPIGWPACWLALGLGLLLLVPRLSARTKAIALPILLSALLYALSYLPLSVASEVRYHLWTETGIAIAAAMMLADTAHHVSRRRLLLVFAPLAIVTMLCVAARLL